MPQNDQIPRAAVTCYIRAAYRNILALKIDDETGGGIEARVRAAVAQEYREWHMDDAYAPDVIAGIASAVLITLGTTTTEARDG